MLTLFISNEIIMMTEFPEELFKQETVYFKTLF